MVRFRPKILCMACLGKGVATNGNRCVPCEGTGRRVERPPLPTVESTPRKKKALKRAARGLKKGMKKGSKRRKSKK